MRRRKRRPERFHADAPWPPVDPWARGKVARIIAADEIGVTVWTDETCGELCVIEHNIGGEMRRHANPGCEEHRTPTTPAKLRRTFTIGALNRKRFRARLELLAAVAEPARVAHSEARGLLDSTFEVRIDGPWAGVKRIDAELCSLADSLDG